MFTMIRNTLSALTCMYKVAIVSKYPLSFTSHCVKVLSSLLNDLLSSLQHTYLIYTYIELLNLWRSSYSACAKICSQYFSQFILPKFYGRIPVATATGIKLSLSWPNAM